MVEWRENGAGFEGLRRRRKGFASHAPAVGGDATEVVHCGSRNERCVTPPSEETGEPRVFSTQDQTGCLLLSSSCAIGVSTLGIPEGFCQATDNEQETAPHCGCCHEYGLGLDGGPHAEKHCPLKSTMEAKKIKTALPVSCCYRNTPVREGQPEKHCPDCGLIGKQLPTYVGVDAKKIETALPASCCYRNKTKKNTTEARSVATESRTLSVASRCTSQHPEIREVRPPGKATRTLEKMFAAAWTGKKADRAAQTAPSAALAAAEHHAGAGALGVGTQHFRAAEDIGNSSARPPGNAQKKQLKDTPK